MNKVINYLIFLSAIIIFAGFVSAANGGCNLDASLVNQDPIHAVPGEYVKVVFQLSGIDNPACGTVNFAISPAYPFSLDPTVDASKTITAGTFTSTYNSQATIPYTLRVYQNALDSDYDLKVNYGSSNGGSTNANLEKHFNISVKDVRSDFDVFVSDYTTATKIITFGILNTGKYNVDALTVDIPKQSTIDVKGSNKAIVGTLDANQDTTFTYEATPIAGDITVQISYNDQNGVRREVSKNITYDPSYFTGRVADVTTTSPWTYVLVIVVIIFVIWLIRRIFFKKKKHVQN